MTTSLVQGFSLTFGFGVLVSMFTAIVLTRTFLLAMVGESNTQKRKKMYFGIRSDKVARKISEKSMKEISSKNFKKKKINKRKNKNR